LLGDYTKHIKGDVDELWEQKDADKNGYLDREEAKKFLNALSGIMEPERAANYTDSAFERVFTKFDEDKNGFLEKSEMAVLIK